MLSYFHKVLLAAVLTLISSFSLINNLKLSIRLLYILQHQVVILHLVKVLIWIAHSSSLIDLAFSYLIQLWLNRIVSVQVIALHFVRRIYALHILSVPSRWSLAVITIFQPSTLHFFTVSNYLEFLNAHIFFPYLLGSQILILLRNFFSLLEILFLLLSIFFLLLYLQLRIFFLLLKNYIFIFSLNLSFNYFQIFIYHRAYFFVICIWNNLAYFLFFVHANLLSWEIF